MATPFLILTLLISCHAFASTNAKDTGFVGSLDHKTLGFKKVSHFRFYFHERFTGSDPTTVIVVPPVPKYNSTSSFGVVGVMYNDDGTGAYVKGSGKSGGLGCGHVTVGVFLIDSTITVLGRNRLSQKVREIPVVGGTEVFKFATGYAETNTIFFDLQTRSTIEYNIYVSQY